MVPRTPRRAGLLRRAGPPCPAGQRDGVILLVVLVVVALMSIANLSYFDWTFTELKAANATPRGEQALSAAESAVEFLRVYLANEPSAIDQDGGLFDNPERFRAMLVADGPEAELRSRAAVVAPRWGRDRPEGGRFGVEDESGRLNLNTLLVAEAREAGAGRDQLVALPGMTTAIADAILDWIDEDDTPREQGAEVEYYSTLDPPYAPGNKPFSTIEQLELVKGVTPVLLWGLDQDRDHEASEAERATVRFENVDNALGQLDGGWASLVTLHSAEANRQPGGAPKINVNADDLEQLHGDIEAVLGVEAANFVVAYRQGGPEESDSQDPLDEDDQPIDVGVEGNVAGGDSAGGVTEKDAGEITIDFAAPAAVAVQDVLDLVGVRVRVVEQGELSVTLVSSPWSEEGAALGEQLTELMQTLTTTDAESIPGRVNVNTAPRSVLAGLPGMPPESVDAILTSRDPESGFSRPDRLQATWLLAEGLLDLEEMRLVAPYVTGQGAVYRAQAIGGHESGGPTKRLEVVVDTTAATPRVVLRRDLSQLGSGFPIEQLLVPEGPALSVGR